jgi:hypothetical protein
MSWRVYRTVRRAASLADAVRTTILLAIGFLPKIEAVANGLKSVHALIPRIGVVVNFIISPYFAPTMVIAAVGLLLWKHWPASHATRAEFFIEMLEERITLARALAKNPKLDFIEWKTWEEKTVLDMGQFLPSLSRHFGLFRKAGELTTNEYEKGDESTKVAIRRQIRMLSELIDRIDRGEIQKEPIVAL